MEVYKDLKKIKKISNCFLTMGTFDGCHLGHQELFKSISNQAIQSNDAQALITYYPHPRNILKKGESLKSLMSIKEKLKIFETYGFDYVLIISFNNSFSNVTASDFLHNIVIKYFNPQKVIIGYDHHFGKNREGSSSFLKKFSKNSNFNIEILNPIKYKDKTIVFMADLLPSTGHIPLPYVMGYDTKPLVTLSEKGRFLKEAADNNYILFLQHDNYNECCTVLHTEKGVRLQDTFSLTDIL